MANKLSPQTEEIVYTAENSLKNPIELMKDLYGGLLASRELAWRLLIRDIKGQYRQSFLGVAWALVPPAMTAIGCALATDAGLLNVQNTGIPYPAYVMLGTVLWQTFVDALNGPRQAVASSRGLLGQVQVPHEAIILAQLGQLLFYLVIKILMTVVVFIVFQTPVHWTIVLSPIAFINLIMFGTAIGLLLVPIVNLIHDVARSLDVALVVWFFITPVLYPAPQEGILSIITKLNPVTYLLVTARDLVTTGTLAYGTGFWIAIAITPIALIFSWIVYRVSLPFLIERIV